MKKFQARKLHQIIKKTFRKRKKTNLGYRKSWRFAAFLVKWKVVSNIDVHRIKKDMIMYFKSQIRTMVNSK